MMKKALTALLAFTLLISLAACTASDAGTAPAASAQPAPAAQSDPVRDDRLEKLNEVSDMILARETVPADYLRYLDQELAAAVEQYNSDTSFIRILYTERATNIVRTLFYEHQEDPGDYAHSDMYYEWVGRISHYAMYENASELCDNDPYLSYTLSKEAGGSGGLWAWRLHQSVPAEVQEQTQDYFTMVDELLTQIDEARAAYAG